LPAFGNVITLPKAGNFLWGNYLPVVGFEGHIAPEFVLNVEILEVSLSLIGQEVKIISPKIRLHWDMKRTIVEDYRQFVIVLEIHVELIITDQC